MSAPLYMSVAQVAEHVGVSQKTIRELIYRGDLPAVRVGSTRTIRIRVGDVDDLLRPVQSLSDARG